MSKTYGLPQRVYDVVERVADRHAAKGVTVEQILSDTRRRNPALARMECYYEVREIKRADGKPAFSFPRIGQMFNRDHTSIILGRRKHIKTTAETEVDHGKIHERRAQARRADADADAGEVA